MLGANTTLLLGDEATVPRVRKAVTSSSPKVIHLATHGLLGNERQPLLASLALSTPTKPTRDDNGFLTLEDILSSWGGQLRGVELVILSACDTGQGVREGDNRLRRFIAEQGTALDHDDVPHAVRRCQGVVADFIRHQREHNYTR